MTWKSLRNGMVLIGTLSIIVMLFGFFLKLTSLSPGSILSDFIDERIANAMVGSGFGFIIMSIVIYLLFILVEDILE
jgi:hypothetical protein